MTDDTYLSHRPTPGRLNLGPNTPIIDVDFASSSNSNCNARYDGDILTRPGTDDLGSPPAFATTPAPLAQKSISRLFTMASKLTPLIRSAIRPVCRAARPQSRAAFAITASRRSDTLMVHRNTEDNNPDIPFKFNEKNQTVIAEILKRYPPQYKKAAVMPLLDLGQRQHGFTSISVMNEVARLLEMPPMRVYEVASFYTMYNRTPVGKYFVQICTTTPCQLGGCGSDVIVKAIKEELGIEQGQTTADGLFTILEVECLGACVNAPMIQINDDYYEDLTPASVKDLLKSLRAQATASDPSTVNVPKPGPLSSRDTCENSAGQTSLNAEPWGTETTRADL